MKNNMFQRIIIIFMIIMMFSASPSYAATHVFSKGTNTITANEYKNGVNFKVKETGIYAITLLPIIEGYEWQFDITNNAKGEKILLAVVQDGVNANTEPIYKLYSDDVPYVLLKKDVTYTLKATNNSQKNKLVTNETENYVTVQMSGPTTTKKGEYYEGAERWINESIEEDKFPLSYAGGVSQQEGVDLINPGVKFEILGGEQKADLLQQLLTSFCVDVIGDGIMFLIGVVAGEPITIDKIIFNEYSRTRLAFFVNNLKDEHGVIDPNKENPFLSDTGILPQYDDQGNLIDEGTLNKFYNRFTMIAIIVYLVILLYMGIRIVLSSTGKDMAKYKKLFTDWVGGVIILFLFPYVMRYTIKINDAVVQYIGTLRNTVVNLDEAKAEITDYPGGLAFPFSYVGSDGSASLDYMSIMRQNALETGRIVYALCWFLMLKELIGFFIIYIKRLLITLFLIVIFPLVAISYAIDKIGDGKSQAFNKWVKEFILNVFLQTFHAINYVVVMGIIFAIGKTSGQTNFILIILGLTYLAKGDKILKGIFSHMKGGGGGTVKDVAESFFATTAVIQMVKGSMSTISNSFKNITKLSDTRLEMSNKSSKIAERKASDKWDEWNLKSMQAANIPGNIAQVDNSISDAVDTVLDKRSSVERIQQSVGYLRQAAIAGGDTQVRYEQKMAELQRENPEKYNELVELMDQSDAVDAMQNLEYMAEAEINANLNVLVRNRTRKGNFSKLDKVLEEKGVTRKMQDKLQKTIQQRELTTTQQADLKKIRTAVYTKDDAQKMEEIKKLETKASEIKNGRRVKLEAELEKTKQHLKDNKGSMKKIHIEQHNKKIQKLQSELDTLSDEPTLEERKELSEVIKNKKVIKAGLINKNLTTKTVKTIHDKATQVAKYRAAAQMSIGEMPSEEHIELAEAQAVLDGSASGEYSLEEIWQASKTVKKAKKKADKDAGIKKILEVAQSNPETAKPEGFHEQVATMIVKNKESLSGTNYEVETMVQEANSALKETAKEGGVYQHILDDAGLGIQEDDDGNESIVTIKEKDSTKEMIKTVEKEKDKQAKEKKEIEGNVLTNTESVYEMKKKLIAERLDFSKAVIKTSLAPTVTTVTGLASAAMYAGASGDYSVVKATGAAKLGSSGARVVKDKAADFTVNTANRVGKFAEKIWIAANEKPVAELNVSKIKASTTTNDNRNDNTNINQQQNINQQSILNQQNEISINIKLDDATASGQYNQHELELMKEIEEKRKELERIERNRERIRQSIARNNNRNNTNNTNNNNESSNA